ncbi:alpha/beta hydrolase family protein [Hymenobacter sp. BT18]|uniref:alpha/beta hydrolase family protein n=1 Tax=Hymenobacter sp. BT18 TaxID=2835648 RepID=UPI00397799A0
MLITKLSFRALRLTWMLWAALLVLPGAGCKSEAAEPTTQPEAPAATYLQSSTLLGEYSTSAVAARVSDIPFVGALAKYPIKVYRLTYRTHDAAGKEVTASGALLVPQVAQALPLLSYQHGTISPAQEDRAPSYYSSRSEIWSAVSVLAASGYIVSAPDYLGYGASKALAHPYEHAATLASASADMLRAAREFCAQQKVSLNKKHFLLGYSEGGFATMALHKLLEEQHASEFTVTASAPGAGAYHKTAFAKYILESQEPLDFLSSYVWVLRTYNQVYGLNRPLTYYFNQPYATQLQADPFGNVPKLPAQLFTSQLRTSVLNGTDQPLLAAFQANDIYDWQPKAPLALFHGTADDYVPFFNSEDAYKAMQARGATQVELRPIEGGDHFSSAATYTLGAYAFISQYY